MNNGPTPLSSCSEQEVILLAQGTGARAKEAKTFLINRHQQGIYKLMRQLGVPRGSKDDAFHAGVVGLLEALRAYDLTRGTKFWTFAYKHVWGEICDCLQELGYDLEPDRPSRAKLPLGVHIGSSWFAEDTGNGDGLELDEVVPAPEVGGEPDPSAQAHLATFLEGLSNDSLQLLHSHFALNRSQSDIARELGRSRQAISKSLKQLYARARIQLHHLQ